MSLQGKSLVRFYSLAARLAVLLIIAETAASGNAQSSILLRRIDNPVPSVADNFGRNLMVTHNGLILCGAAGSEVEGEGFSNSGVAYLVNGETGAIAATMPNPEPDTNVGFGAFSWAGDTKVVVSAIGKSDGATTASGRVYVFNLSNGAHTQTIGNPTPGSVDWFGYGLGMLGDTAIIGAPGDDTSGDGTGTVYIYNSLSGVLNRTVPNPEPTTQDGFGYSVAGIGGSRFAVGAPATDIGAKDAGAVYIMDAVTGAVAKKITNPEPSVGAFFGFQVRTHGDDILIGSPGSNKAYVYDGETGQQILRFENPAVKPGAFFGSTVGSAGKNVLIGNPLEPYDEVWVGRAYLFDGVSGALLQTFDNPSPEKEDRFGVSVAGLNGNLVISADQNRVNDIPFAGSIYVYSGPRSGACCEWTLFE